MSPPPTTILIVPGFWLGPHPYSLLTSSLKEKSPSPIDIIFGPLLSTGTRSPNAPTMASDAAHIRSILLPLVEAGKRVVIVAHSAGAFISAMATEGLERGVWKGENGGGVERFVFVAGGVLPKGGWHPPTNWEAENGAIWLSDVDSKLFHDVPPSIAAEHCIPHLKSQPTLDEWSKECTYTGWDKIPSTYIICENDRVIDPKVQEMCAGLARSEVVRIPTGHMPMLSCPGVLAERVLGCMGLGE